MSNPMVMDATVTPENVTAALADLLGQHLQKSQSAENIRQALGYTPIRKATGTPQGPYMHGPGGLFGVRGLDREVISTHLNIQGSLGDVIPIEGSNEMNPLFPYITGFQRSDGQEKNAICDDPEEAGSMKTCIQTTVFGRKEFKTRTIEVNAVGRVINRSEFTDLVVVNDPLVRGMGGLMQNFLGLQKQSQALELGREMVARMIEVGVAYQRWFCPQVYVAHPANSTAGGGYKEFPGLNLLIGRNKVDALTGTACPSLYSLLANFNFRNVSSSTEPTIHRTLSTMLYYIEDKARKTGLAPVRLALVMRPQLFFELTRVWPLQYNTDGAALVLSGQAGLDAVYLESIRQRDDMRQNNYLIINSKRYEVILDDCIDELNNADNNNIPAGDSRSSDIYIVPLSARTGTVKTLYWQYIDFREGPMTAIGDARATSWFWTDGGVFLWGVRPPNNWCLDMISKTEPRLILRTPQLAARLQNVVYNALIHTDDVLPSQDYWVNGGVTTGRPGPSPYSEWNPGGPGFSN